MASEHQRQEDEYQQQVNRAVAQQKAAQKTQKAARKTQKAIAQALRVQKENQAVARLQAALFTTETAQTEELTAVEEELVATGADAGRQEVGDTQIRVEAARRRIAVTRGRIEASEKGEATHQAASRWRVHLMHINEAAARRRAQAAQKRAEAATRRAEAAAHRQAFRQTVRQIAGLFSRRRLMFWGALRYLLLSVIGIFSTWTYYLQFHVPIFEYFDASDFLLSAFRTSNMFIAVLITTLAISLSLVPWATLNYKSNYQFSIQSAHNFITETEQEPLYRWGRALLASFVIGISIILIIPSLWGWYDSKKVIGDGRQEVRVMIRRDVDRSAIHLPCPAILLGTTSDFHLFYEHIEKNQRDRKCRAGGESRNGRTFLVPTANLSSLELILEPKGLHLKPVYPESPR